MTNSCFSKQQWPSTAICLGWRREEFAYSMHWCVPLRGTESSPYFVSAVGGRFSVLNVRCDMLWLSSLTVETDSWVLYIIQIIQLISEMLVSSCISFNRADNTIRELDRFNLEMSWTMDRCLGNEPFWQDTQYICITTQYESVWTIMNMFGFVLKTNQPIISIHKLSIHQQCSHVFAFSLHPHRHPWNPSTNRSIEARVTLYLRGTDAMTSLWRYHMTPAKSPWASHG
jgi:hypothetical protein